MPAASILDSMVSVTSLNHGGASKALSQVGDNHPVVVLKKQSAQRGYNHARRLSPAHSG